MYWTYLTNKGKKVYLYDFIDKQLQGELSDNQPKLENTVHNIYINNQSTIAFLNNYLESLSLVYTAANDLIVQKNSTHDYVDNFVENIKRLLPEDFYFPGGNWADYNWEIKKQLFLGSESSPYNFMVKNMRKLFYCLGEVGLDLPFESVYYSLTNYLRKDFKLFSQYRTESYQDIVAKLKRKLNKIDASEDFMLRIQLCSLQEYILLQNTSSQFHKMSQRFIDGKELFEQFYNDREILLKHICSVYYLQGMEIYKEHSIKEGRNKIYKRDFQVQKSDSKTHLCPVCQKEVDTVFSIKFFNDRPNTITTVCSMCLLDIAQKLVIEENCCYSDLKINKQMMVSYANHQFPTDICECCGFKTKAAFTIMSAYNRDFKLCKKCFTKLVDKAAPKNTKRK